MKFIIIYSLILDVKDDKYEFNNEIIFNKIYEKFDNIIKKFNKFNFNLFNSKIIINLLIFYSEINFIKK